MDINSLGLGAAIPTFGAQTLGGLEFEPAGNAGVFQLKSNPTSSRQGVRFYWKDIFDPAQTKATQQPVYKKRLMVEIRTPGDNTIYDGFAEEYHKRNYWTQYKRFQEGKGVPEGRPIEEATDFILGPEIVDLKYLGVHTVEQLAEASDILCQQLPRGFELRDNARMWCKITKDTALMDVTKKMSGELTQARETIKLLQDEMRQMKELFQYQQQANVVETAAREALADAPAEAPKTRKRKTETAEA